MSFRYPERRNGFDRRRSSGGMVRATYLRALGMYGDSPRAVAVVVVGFVALSAADLWLTMRALGAGATELNPFMAALFDRGATTAAIVKMSLALAVAGVLWAARRYRRVLEVSLFATGLMAALLGYHLIVMR